ncbi:DNA N-glycosylase and apurinic/apyrimidinic (AP) lyase [Orbilia oligospora]|uniref:Endonuclease III homolog n=1 Tax=Orbilia oligospora TaxID=2813651 RepID=A0A7C8K3R8_ORBOL|nr:DNA N-glycosylase and apurinic/apyrimidinic (AP) lyase [Orbilia oligospora]KAF3178172.1 DNA N-glycosylase and apurinic/apyrimidinic (AP) lyase [Orbilia oligospora]KAF3248441.1 DNA N-glycosylase and apurinic/apyrimidinic (AP) lyase [Orbilia oligospora]KAF3256565.1 DNA N-glycosylase and apurinic/apyrimidinic (AP) lyase [Orbilia oligospora]KAF3279660.1 DNA N-glycosylase and apurinic/apyrimidinic (AP) lyase [Orbilia oligospora]
MLQIRSINTIFIYLSSSITTLIRTFILPRLSIPALSVEITKMRSAKTQAAQKIRSFANTTPTTRRTRTSTGTSTTTTTIVSKLPSSQKSKPKKVVAEEQEDEDDNDISDSELSSAPSDLESAYSESQKASSDDDDEEYTTSPYFNSSSSLAQPSKKRKHNNSNNNNARIKTEDDAIKTEEEEDDYYEGEEEEEKKPKPKSKSKPKPKSTPKTVKVKKEKGKYVDVQYDPPENWREMYDLIKEMRLRIPAPVDTVGCARLAQKDVPPKVKRFQHLIALMMSSQTKDQVTGEAMRRLQTELPGGLTLESILEVSPARLNELIGQVGFHNRKTEYIKKAAVVLRDKFDGDIPTEVEDMMSLDGVGPKMSYLLEQCAWDKSTGIGVDVHVHRIANMFKWVPQSSEPEVTRVYLQSWLPKELWREINWLLVGFGQSVCLPRGRRCDLCTLGPKSTGGNGMCKASIVVKNKAPTTPKKIKREVKIEEDEDGVVVKKEEEMTEESNWQVADPLGIDADADIKIKKEEIKEETETFPSEIPDIEDIVGRPRRNAKRKR